MIKPGGESESAPVPPAATNLVVVQHFDEELKRLLPSKQRLKSYALSGWRHRSPLKRAKSLSVVINSQPFSIASAAR